MLKRLKFKSARTSRRHAVDVSIRDVPYLTLTDSEQKNVEMKVDENVTVDQQEQQIFTGGLPMVPVGLRCRWATHVYNFVF